MINASMLVSPPFEKTIEKPRFPVSPALWASAPPPLRRLTTKDI